MPKMDYFGSKSPKSQNAGSSGVTDWRQGGKCPPGSSDEGPLLETGPP